MKYALSMIVALAFCTAMAVAQAGGYGGAAGSQNNPSMQQPGTQQPAAQQPGMGQQPETNPSTRETEQNTATNAKSEKKLKGCVESEGGQYELETKKGKEIVLNGQDVASHVGHEVEVKGYWENAGSSGMSSTSSGKTGERSFNVSSVKMISESCSGKSKGTSGSMGTAPGGTNPNGTGSTGSPSGTGPANTPPQ